MSVRDLLRRPLTTGTVLALAASALTALAGPAAAAARSAAPTIVVGPTAPNILYINLDDGRYDALKYMPKTLAWMEWTARNYTNARVTIPSCCPSRATLFTGRYSHNNGVKLQSDAQKLDSDYTLMAYLKGAGYLTAMTGKFLNSWPSQAAPPYFDKWTTTKGGYYNFNAYVDGSYRYVTQYSTTFLGQQLRNYLAGFESQDSRPWFAYFAPQAPHIAGGWKTLATPEAKYATAPVAPCAQPGETDRSDKPAYVRWTNPDPAYVESMCESQIRTLMSVDDQIALMFQQLKAAGEVANTMFVVTSDNGNNWGEQGWFSKFYPYEPSVRVPLLIRWDAGGITKSVDTRMVSDIDFLPSVLRILGITPTKPLDGKPLLFGTDNRTDFFTEYFYDTANGQFPSWAALTNGVRKYIETYQVDSSGRTTVFKEYYRLQSDPTESVNVLRDGDPANDPSAAELAELSAELAAARSCVGSACP